MSVAEFSATLKSEAYKRWFKASGTNILNKTVTELRDKEESAEKTDFLITQSTVKDVVASLTGKKASASETAAVMARLRQARPKFFIETIEKNADGTVKEVYLKFTRLNLEQIGRLVDNAFTEQIKSSGKRVSEFFQRGHVVGVATNLVKQTAFGIQQSNISEQQKKLLLDFLDEYIKELQRADFETSNLKDPEHAIYGKYTKNYRRYLVELQPKALNTQAGRDVVPISNSLRKYFKPENFVYLSERNLLKESDNNFFKKLITSKGSPSMLDLLQEAMVDTLRGKKIKNRTYSSAPTEVAKVKTKVQTSDTRKQIKDEVNKAKRLQDKIRKLTISRDSTSNLVSLQALLDRELRPQIERNMGTGEATNILNYRTGRFADSVKVQRLTVSREGMITAFYDYMRYPYATFSEGGVQQYPKTRDPKLLIAQSIRDVAGSLVSNRLRSVLV